MYSDTFWQHFCVWWPYYFSIWQMVSKVFLAFHLYGYSRGRSCCVWWPNMSYFSIWQMVSKAFQEDLDMLLNMEMKLRLLDLEDVPIPDVPPPVPRAPDNYDFFYGDWMDEGEWMDEFVGVNEWTNKFSSGWVDGLLWEFLSVWVNESASEWASEQELMNKFTSKWVDGLLWELCSEWMSEWTSDWVSRNEWIAVLM